MLGLKVKGVERGRGEGEGGSGGKNNLHTIEPGSY